MTAPTALDLDAELESHRGQLTGYCYRLLGSGADAQDAVQETMIRAWRSSGTYQGRSSLRTWLYRIATNVCIDMARSRSRRARPMDLGPVGAPTVEALAAAGEGEHWVLPVPTDTLDPAEVTARRDDVRLAFVAALQHLPPRQRAVLVLAEVLRFPAAEIAALLETSTASVNSALQRARATMADRHDPRPAELSPELAGLLARYVAAFERYDMDALVRLLRDDVVMNMPPYALWLQGPADVATWMLGPGAACRGSRLVATSANGGPAWGQYKPDPGGGYSPWALVVPEVAGDRIGGLTFFLETAELFPAFGLAPALAGDG